MGISFSRPQKNNHPDYVPFDVVEEKQDDAIEIKENPDSQWSKMEALKLPINRCAIQLDFPTFFSFIKKMYEKDKNTLGAKLLENRHNELAKIKSLSELQECKGFNEPSTISLLIDFSINENPDVDQDCISNYIALLLALLQEVNKDNSCVELVSKLANTIITKIQKIPLVSNHADWQRALSWLYRPACELHCEDMVTFLINQNIPLPEDRCLNRNTVIDIAVEKNFPKKIIKSLCGQLPEDENSRGIYITNMYKHKILLDEKTPEIPESISVKPLSKNYHLYLKDNNLPETNEAQKQLLLEFIQTKDFSSFIRLTADLNDTVLYEFFLALFTQKSLHDEKSEVPADPTHLLLKESAFQLLLTHLNPGKICNYLVHNNKFHLLKKFFTAWPVNLFLRHVLLTEYFGDANSSSSLALLTALHIELHDSNSASFLSKNYLLTHNNLTQLPKKEFAKLITAASHVLAVFAPDVEVKHYLEMLGIRPEQGAYAYKDEDYLFPPMLLDEKSEELRFIPTSIQYLIFQFIPGKPNLYQYPALFDYHCLHYNLKKRPETQLTFVRTIQEKIRKRPWNCGEISRQLRARKNWTRGILGLLLTRGAVAGIALSMLCIVKVTPGYGSPSHAEKIESDVCI